MHTWADLDSEEGADQMYIERLKPFLLYFYGMPFFCWIFDVLTTFYAIEVLGVAAEMNPLGWPLGIVGALLFYIPSLIFTHLLLFRIKNKYSLLTAILITALALSLGAMSLFAGLHNIDVAQMH